MATIENSIEFQNAMNDLDRSIRKSIKYIVEKTYDQLIINIEKDVYDGNNIDYFNKSGNPTREFLNAWDSNVIRESFGKIAGEIFYVKERVNPMKADSNNSWNAHMGKDGKDFNGDELAQVLNRLEKRIGLYRTTERRKGKYWDDTLSWLENNFDKMLKEQMAIYGWEIE